MTDLNVFGPQTSHARTDQPQEKAILRYGQVQSYFKNCTAPGRSDGTQADAEFFNNIIGNLTKVVDAGNVSPRVRGDYYLLLSSIRAIVAQVVATLPLDGRNLPLPRADRLGGIYADSDPYKVCSGVGLDGHPVLNTFASLGLAVSGDNRDIASLGPVAVPDCVDGTSTSQIANTKFVQRAIALLVGASPTTLDTIYEIDAAIGNDPNFATTVMTALATKAAKGANSDITQLSGLTTPLSLGQGGTGATSTSGFFDAAFGTTQGTVIVRGNTGWVARSSSTAGQVLTFDGTDTQFLSPGGAVSARSNVRQTVQTGPQSGTPPAPSFLPNTTSGTLTLTTQNVGTGVNALTIAAAAGSNSTGQFDYVMQFTSNVLSWTLPASTYSYLFVNAQSGATLSSSLAPIYQFGGAISTTNGQFTFDISTMTGYMGNGTSAVATPLVCVGEANTSASQITSTVAYAYNGYYDSGYVSVPGAGTPYSVTHNIGGSGVALKGDIYLNCLTANQGYSPGDVLLNPTTFMSSSVSVSAPIWTQPKTGGFTVGNAATGSFYVTNKGTGAGGYITNASWSVKTIFRRGWGGA